MRYLAILAAAGSLTAVTAPAQAAELPAAPALSFGSYSHSAFALSPVAAYDDDWDDDDDYRQDRRRYKRNRDRDYDNGRRLGRQDQVWRGNDGQYRCRRADGTVGLVIGAGVGALLGREIDKRGDRTLGTILGAVGGGLLGREVARGEVRCR
jgi:hypothetical protein